MSKIEEDEGVMPQRISVVECTPAERWEGKDATFNLRKNRRVTYAHRLVGRPAKSKGVYVYVAP